MRDVTLSVVRSDRFVIARVEPTPGPVDQVTDAQVNIGVTICLIRSPGFLRSRVKRVGPSPIPRPPVEAESNGCELNSLPEVESTGCDLPSIPASRMARQQLRRGHDPM